jgi:hypothetical protein
MNNITFYTADLNIRLWPAYSYNIHVDLRGKLRVAMEAGLTLVDSLGENLGWSKYEQHLW